MRLHAFRLRKTGPCCQSRPPLCYGMARPKVHDTRISVRMDEALPQLIERVLQPGETVAAFMRLAALVLAKRRERGGAK